MSPYAALAEPSRRHILDLLRVREHSVTELVAHLDLSQPGVSKHLKVLREAGLVQARAEGKVRWYGLRAGAPRSPSGAPGGRGGSGPARGEGPAGPAPAPSRSRRSRTGSSRIAGTG